MNQNTCKTCKWWQWNNNPGFITGSGQFLAWDTPLIQFVCGGTGQWNAANGMVDAEDYGGVLTGPDFGCIHYEETQEQLPQDHPGYAMQQSKLSIRSITKEQALQKGLNYLGEQWRDYPTGPSMADQFKETRPHCDHVYDSAICAGGDWYYICSKCGRSKPPEAAMA